jgi:hypothetical protein
MLPLAGRGLLQEMLPTSYALLFIACAAIYWWLSSHRALDRIPNAHWSARWSYLWIIRARVLHRELPLVHAAHQRLGSIVRTGPKELSISCWDNGVRKVYGGGMEKPAYYDFYRYLRSHFVQLLLLKVSGCVSLQ